jgi:hypothetical protein
MVANTSPIYTLTPDLSNNNGTGMNATITAAAADYTGISANNRLVHTAGADGSFVRRLRCKPLRPITVSSAKFLCQPPQSALRRH